MILKRLRQIAAFFTLTLVVAQFACAQSSWMVDLQFSPNPSPYLSDWSSRVNTVQLFVTNTDPTPRAVKILADIMYNGELVAFTNPDKVQPQTIPAGGTRTFFGEGIVPMAAVHFEDNLDQSTQRAGRLPDGTICVTIKVVDASTLALIQTDRECATILSYTSPYLILPENEAVLCKLGQNNVIEMNTGNPRPMFRWTPVVPQPNEPVRYRFAVFEVMAGQNPATAFRSARPLFERELLGMTELIWPVEYFYPEAGKRYVWGVRALDFLGRPLVSYQDGWSTPFYFTVTDACKEGNIDIDGDGIPDISAFGASSSTASTFVDQSSLRDIQVKITKADPSPLDPDIGHEFSGRAQSATGGPFNYNWYLREVGTPRYIPLKKQPIPLNLWLAPGDAKPSKSYLLKLVAEKNGRFGWDEISIVIDSSDIPDLNGDGLEGNSSATNRRTREAGGAIGGGSSKTTLVFSAKVTGLQQTGTDELKLDVVPSEVAAIYNPKEIGLDKSVPWQKHRPGEGNQPTLEFTAASPKTMQAELLFDTYEEEQDVRKGHLEQLVRFIGYDSTKRPPLVTFSWGQGLLPVIIKDLGIKFTMFSPKGIPSRATVNLELRPATPADERTDSKNEESEEAETPQREPRR